MNAVIYARVSTEEQVHGTSLATQVKACKEYAAKLGLNVPEDHIFIEEGVSAKLLSRPKLNEMQRFCAANPKTISHCIVWKVDRLARKSEYHHIIVASLKKLSIKLESATEVLTDDPMGEMMSGLLAVFAQLENDVRTARTVEGMKARTLQGGWPHTAPVGYRKWTTPTGVTSVQPDEKADLVRTFLEEFSTGAYSVAEAIDLAYKLGIRGQTQKYKSWQPIKNILTNPLYAGLVKTKYSDGQEIAGLHQSIISEETYRKNLRIINGRGHSYAPAKDEWPLRGKFMLHTCGKPMTGSSPKGRSGPSPRYSCVTCRSSVIGKPVSTAKATVHEQFLQFLDQYRVSDDVLRLFKVIVMKKWNNSYADSSLAIEQLQKEEYSLRDKRSRIISLYIDDKLSDSEKNEQIELVEQAMADLLLRKVQLEERFELSESMIDAAVKLLESPGLYWTQGDNAVKQVLQNLIFPKGVIYDCVDGFRTTEISASYLLIQKIAPEDAKNSTLVAATGIEPVTSSL